MAGYWHCWEPTLPLLGVSVTTVAASHVLLRHSPPISLGAVIGIQTTPVEQYHLTLADPPSGEINKRQKGHEDPQITYP